MENKDNEKNNIVKFIKKFIKNHKVNLDGDSLLKFIMKKNFIFII